MYNEKNKNKYIILLYRNLHKLADNFTYKLYQLRLILTEYD